MLWIGHKHIILIGNIRRMPNKSFIAQVKLLGTKDNRKTSVTLEFTGWHGINSASQ